MVAEPRLKARGFGKATQCNYKMGTMPIWQESRIAIVGRRAARGSTRALLLRDEGLDELSNLCLLTTRQIGCGIESKL